MINEVLVYNVLIWIITNVISTVTLKVLSNNLLLRYNILWKFERMRRADGGGNLGTLLPTNKITSQVTNVPK